MIDRSSSVSFSSFQHQLCPPTQPFSQNTLARNSLPFATARPNSIVPGFFFQSRCLNGGNRGQEKVHSTVLQEFSLAVRRIPLSRDVLFDLRITRRRASALQLVTVSIMVALRPERGFPTRSPRPRRRQPAATGFVRTVKSAPRWLDRRLPSWPRRIGVPTIALQPSRL